MEPDIPDGSIVLVRDTREIENGKNGAFALNGVPYCKKLKRNPDGLLSLVSSNPNYPPIPVGEDDHLHVFGEIIKIIPPEENR